MPQYKLTYFNTKARGEIARLLFAIADQEYVDERIEAGPEWLRLKPTTPFCQIPVLEVDGQRICQSGTINRFLAKKFGLAGKTEWEVARADMIADTLSDFTAPLEELRKKFQEESIPMFFSRFEKQLEMNGTGFFAGNEMTWADVSFFHHTHYPEAMKFTVDWDKYPRCKALRDKMASHPRVAEWVKKRPVTVF